MPHPDLDRPDDRPDEPGYQTWTPRRGRGVKLAAWVILAGVAACILGMLVLMLWGP